VLRILGKAIPDWRTEMAHWSTDGLVEPLKDSTVSSWHVSAESRVLLSEVGLPAFGSIFTRWPQDLREPLAPPFYILGRETVEEHPHMLSMDASCGCGYFGVSAADGTVSQLFPRGEILPVNSSLPLFYYFLHKVGGAWPRPDSEVSERIAARRAEAVMRRLTKRDPILTSGIDSFWGYLFARPWG
jgi:hypothetical protein